MIFVDMKYHHLARGDFQRAVCDGAHNASLTTLRGSARSWIRSYTDSLESLASRAVALGANDLRFYALKDGRWHAIRLISPDALDYSHLRELGFTAVKPSYRSNADIIELKETK